MLMAKTKSTKASKSSSSSAPPPAPAAEPASVDNVVVEQSEHPSHDALLNLSLIHI